MKDTDVTNISNFSNQRVVLAPKEGLRVNGMHAVNLRLTTVISWQILKAAQWIT